MENGTYLVDVIQAHPCRICNGLDATLNIFIESLEKGVLLHQALEYITCLQINVEDGLSQHMCPDCCKRLLDAYEFKNQALESYRDISHDACQRKYSIQLNNSSSEEDIELELDEDEGKRLQQVNRQPPSSRKKPEVDMTTDAVSFLLEHTLNTNRDAELSENKEPPVLEEVNPQSKSKDKGLPENKYPPASPTKPVLGKAKPQSKRKRSSKYKCHVCEKILPKHSNLQDHLRMHANMKKFACSYCDMAFVQVANYRTHLRIHTKERPFECNLCPKTYNQASLLKIHIRSHTNERNYICTVCPKRFTNSSDLNKHKRLHDPSQQFQCEHCGKHFAQKINMKKHIAKVHGE